MLSDGTWSYTWQHGRQLSSMTDGTTTWSFTYNADGLRTGRSDGSTTYKYFYIDGKLSHMLIGSSYAHFAYDTGGAPIWMRYNGTRYYYVTNLQGDVVAILDANGNSVVQYTYDAWGKVLSITGSMADTIGTINPLLYRGYIYDHDTGLYYLQSRYYNPAMSRWINLDSQLNNDLGVLGANLYAYCLNNPVNKTDWDGKDPGDYFSNADQAAIDAAKYMYKLGTFDKTYEYGATIYRVTKYAWKKVLQFSSFRPYKIFLFDIFRIKRVYKLVLTCESYYTYTTPITFRLNNFVLPPFHARAVAMIHTHPYVKGLGYDEFSGPDKIYSQALNLPYYLYTATGRLLVYSPSNNDIRQICKDLEKDPHLP